MPATASLPQTLTPCVAETETELLTIETKARNEMATPEVAATIATICSLAHREPSGLNASILSLAYSGSP
jgi:hypothetical protein